MNVQEYCQLTSGPQVPSVGLGTWELRASSAERVVAAALETGYRHLDTATVYDNEASVGAAVTASGIPRRELFVVTKLPAEAAGRERQALERSLEALGLDYVDLWLVHWPMAPEAMVPGWEAVLRAQSQGLVAEVGVSNHSIEQIDHLSQRTGVTPAVNQLPWSPWHYDPGLLASHADREILLVGYTPLRYSNLDHPTVAAIAARHSRSAAQVLLRWQLEHGAATIPKTSSIDRLKENFDLFGWSLTLEEVERLDSLASVALS